MAEISMPFSSQRVLLAEAPQPTFPDPSTAGSDGQDADASAAGETSANFSIDVVSDLASVAVMWQVFEKIADCTPFQTFGWLDHWQQHIGTRRNSQPAIVLGRGDDGDLLFILPLAIERGGLRRLTWLGMEHGDYCAPLLAETFSRHPAAANFSDVWDRIVKALRSDARYQFDLVDLPKMPEMVGAQQNPFLQLKVDPNRSSAYLATLGTNWDAYFSAKRSASSRKTLRRKQKQLESYGTIRLVEESIPDRCARTLETLITQKTRAFARMGVENIFQRPGYPEFYAAVVTDAEMRDIVHVSHLDVGTTMAATNVALRFRERYYLILTSYTDGEISRFGPGRTHLHELLRYAIENGFRQFDFTIGDEPYKLDWSDVKLELYDHLAAVTLRGRLVAAAIMLQRRMIRFIKQRPFLRELAVKIRARMRRGGRPAESAETAD